MLSERNKREIRSEAAKWWDARGRTLIPKYLNENQGAPSVRIGGTGPTIIVKKAKEADLNNGILMGRPWAELTPIEQANVMISYFENTWFPAHLEIQMVKRQKGAVQ